MSDSAHDVAVFAEHHVPQLQELAFSEPNERVARLRSRYARDASCKSRPYLAPSLTCEIGYDFFDSRHDPAAWTRVARTSRNVSYTYSMTSLDAWFTKRIVPVRGLIRIRAACDT